MKLTQTIPAMPVRDMTAAVAFYESKLGFEALHHDGGFTVLGRDDAVVHLWESSDEAWRQSMDPDKPVCSGAESFIAGTASFRVNVDNRDSVDELYDELGKADVPHPVSKDGVEDTDVGTHEFSALDLDGNLIGFFTWVKP